jgi:hypothetical protein
MIRLADREGRLQGSGMSVMQRFCGRVMLMLDRADHAKGELDAVKRSVMAAAPAMLGPELFPEYFPPEEWDLSTDIREGVRITNSGSITDAEVDEMLRAAGVTPRVK